jgi:hypothetical protein
MKFKPWVLLVTGLLVGSVGTLVLAPSSPQEVSACIHKISGKVRLTVKDDCDSATEKSSVVNDLWALQPTTTQSDPPRDTDTSVPSQLTKHVVDSNGRDLGVLISNDGFQSFWVVYRGGRFNINAGGGVSGEGWAGDPIAFSDKTCQIPFIMPVDSTELSSLRAVVDLPPPGAPSNKTTRKAFRPIGKLVSKPKFVYRYNRPQDAKYWSDYYQTQTTTDPIDPELLWRTKAGCLRLSTSEFEQNMSGGLPARLYKSTTVALPVFTSPLKIVEK